VSLADLVRHRRHAAPEKLVGVADHVIPFEGQAGIDLVGLDVEVAQDTLLSFAFNIRS
jgi:hypothetical protein